MSGVELPRVPSARSTASSSSSSIRDRRSLHSAGSTASCVSSQSQRYVDEDDAEEEEEEEGDEEEEDEPHESSSGSGGLWDEVESFLNKPSPSFVALAKNDNSKPTASAALPTLRANANSGGDETTKKNKTAAAGSSSNQSAGAGGRRPSRSTPSTTGSSKIDPRLLQEAFAYAEKIQKNGALTGDDEDEELLTHARQQRPLQQKQRDEIGMLRRDASFSNSNSTTGNGHHGSGRGPRMPSTSTSSENTTKKKPKQIKSISASSAYGASVKPVPHQPPKRNPSKKNMTKESGGWDSTPSSADPQGDGLSRKGSSSSSSTMMDQQTMQSLVSNLQQGTSVEELRRELMASQQSLAMSRQVIQEAAKSFFQTKK